MFEKTAPGWGRIKQLPARPGELVAEEGEVSEDWACVGNGRGQGRTVAEGAGILKGDRMSSAGGGGGAGGASAQHHLSGPGLSLASAALSAVALILRRNKNKAIIMGVPAS